MNVPSDLKYTKEHEWIKVSEEGVATIGITDFAQSELGEIVYVEVDTVGETLDAEEVFGTVEAVKTTSDLFLPVGGEILEMNPALDEGEGDNPGLINSDPYGEGWIVKVKLSDSGDLDNLLDADAYKALIG